MLETVLKAICGGTRKQPKPGYIEKRLQAAFNNQLRIKVTYQGEARVYRIALPQLFFGSGHFDFDHEARKVSDYKAETNAAASHPNIALDHLGTGACITNNSAAQT
ncbi:MAG TPA: hypothetical protein VHP58_01880 [Alphaproteobacteria bacterium]|nr:hypothetical protein [Alphaproteobacteria bacterium]